MTLRLGGTRLDVLVSPDDKQLLGEKISIVHEAGWSINRAPLQRQFDGQEHKMMASMRRSEYMLVNSAQRVLYQCRGSKSSLSGMTVVISVKFELSNSQLGQFFIMTASSRCMTGLISCVTIICGMKLTVFSVIVKSAGRSCDNKLSLM